MSSVLEQTMDSDSVFSLHCWLCSKHCWKASITKMGWDTVNKRYRFIRQNVRWCCSHANHSCVPAEISEHNQLTGLENISQCENKAVTVLWAWEHAQESASLSQRGPKELRCDQMKKDETISILKLLTKLFNVCSPSLITFQSNKTHFSI